MILSIALGVMIIIYAPQYWHEYQAPKAYCLALAVFGGFLILPPVTVTGVLPCLLFCDLIFHASHLVRLHVDRAALFSHALLIAWAFLIAGHGDPQSLLYALLIASGLITLIVLAEFAGYGIGSDSLHNFGRISFFGKIQGRRPAGPLGNPDILGSFSAAAVPLAFALLYPFSAALSLIALVLSQARASWIAVGLPGLPLISSYLWLSRNEILADRSIRDRFKFYRCAWALIRQRPLLGYGAGAFKFLSQRTFQRPRLAHAHSEWLELWVELGAIGLMLRLTIVGLAFWHLFQGDRLSIAFGLALVVLCVDGLFSLSLRTVGVQIVFWSIIGLAMLHGNPAGAYFGGAWNICLWAIPNAAILYLMADWNFKKGAGLLLSGNFEGLKYLLKALKCDPYHRDARYALALGCLEAGQERAAQAQMAKLSKIDPYYLQEGDGNL